MAHVWTEKDGASGWAVVPLSGEAFALCHDGLAALDAAGGEGDHQRPALLVRRQTAGGEQWILLATAESCVRLNGDLVVIGTRVLDDRDEIVWRDAVSGMRRQIFFATERLAKVESLPAAREAVICARCKQAIEQASLAVRCPNPRCGAWFHQRGEQPCWTYHETCAMCDQPTVLDAGYRWTPEEL